MGTVDNSGLDAWVRARESRLPSEPELPLQGGGGGGTSDDMVPIKEYVDARDDAIESRLGAKLDKLPSSDTVRNNIWGAALTVLGILLAVLAFGGDRFDAGIGQADSRQTQLERDSDQDNSMAEINEKLDILIAGSELKGR